MSRPKKETIVHAYRTKGDEDEICVSVNNSVDIKEYDFERLKDFVKNFLNNQKDIAHLLTIACLENIHDLGMPREEFIQMVNEMYDELDSGKTSPIILTVPYKPNKVKN